MSNLSGNYKINAGDVDAVDAVREQERRARLQLLDVIREPSPQPIFGEPVKVELEDETSRRIKNTLGDFTQVLVNDTKNLLGVSRTSAATSGHGSLVGSRIPPTSKRPPIQNGMYKPSNSNVPKHPQSDKHLGYPRNKPHDPINCPPTSLHSDSRSKDHWERYNQRKPGAPPSSIGSSQNNNSNPSQCPNVPSNKTYPHLHNGMGSSSGSRERPASRNYENSNAPPPKRSFFRPSSLKLPERKPEKPTESPKRDHELETILREMKQAVPPPLTAIQTPRTEESGFSFPLTDLPREEVILNAAQDMMKLDVNAKSGDLETELLELPKQKESNSRQSTPSPLLKKKDSNISVVVDPVDKFDGGRKEPDSYKLGKMPQKTDSYAAEPEVVEIDSPTLETEKATELLESLLNESDKCPVASSLQADLAMSDSDDEAVPEAKNAETKISLDISSEYPKSPLHPSTVNSINSSTVINKSTMDVPQSVPSNSSSSESGDSDSDDSSSESNSSDSSSSSSDADTPSKMWGLSNFFDETRRIHSPAFVPMDTSTNSSTAAVREEPAVVSQDAKEGYSLVDEEDSVRNTIRDPSVNGIPKLLELDPSVTVKNEILSPIASPVGAPALPPPLPPPPPPPPPQTTRGPRTPPSPSYSVTDEMVATIIRNSVSPRVGQTEYSVAAELTLPQLKTNKHSSVPQTSCDKREESGKVQMTTAKKRLSKNKSEIFSPRTDSSPVTMYMTYEECEPSASKGLPDVSLAKEENDLVSLTFSSSVPSETSESSHENYSIKTRQKASKSSSAKKSKTLGEESLSESGQNENSESKSPISSKFKHPTRTRRASTDTKQLSKVCKSSSKIDQTEVNIIKKVSSKTLKEKNSSEKSKSFNKTSENVKGLSKNSVKIKKKSPKLPPKQVSEGKKGEVKRKKSKFHIENFLQSPTISQSESGLFSKVSSSVSPSRDSSPISDKNFSENKRRPSVSPSRASRSPSRSSSKSVERVKNEKLRRSRRCSERASSAAESSAAVNEDVVSKKSSKRMPKLKEHADDSPIHLEAPPSLLSPIPHDSPIPMTLSECAIPDKIMVSIPLDKLSRLPATTHALDFDSKPPSKKRRLSADESILKNPSVSVEKSSKNVSSKRSVSKEIKDKPRTDSNAKSNKSSKNVLVSKKDKNIKATGEPSTVKSKTSSSVNNKSSIKSTDSKTSWESNEKASKKRKNEDSKQSPKKKPKKPHPEGNQDRQQVASIRVGSPLQLGSAGKSKGLERCDSVSSLSSLSSQMSQKSSKGKKSSAVSDVKSGKSPCHLIKHIKQEKDEIIKTTIKKEPGTPEKCKEKSRDKLLSKEADCNEKNVLDPLWNDASSQYSPWGDPCKDDSKGSLSITIVESLNRMDWISFDIKDAKDASNLKQSNAPIMPMDYYYTEGRKQRQLAEKEKDPFLQTLKYFEATVLFILTSQQREECTKEPDSIYRFYRETLNFSNSYVYSLMIQNVRIQHSSPGSVEFKLLILLLRCQALLHVKLYNLKIKEIKEQQKTVSDFFLLHCPATVRSLTHPLPSNPKNNRSISSPHSPTPSPASSVNSQTSGYSSSDVSCSHRNSLIPFSPSVSVSQNTLETICRQNTHLNNLHMGHDLWEQADMYMTRSNLREFFKEVADQSENLTLHSSIKELVNYIQTGISLVKKCSR